MNNKDMEIWDKKKSLKVLKYLESKISPKIKAISLTIKLCEKAQDYLLEKYVLDDKSGPIFIGVLFYYIYALIEDEAYSMGKGIIHLLNIEYKCKYTLPDWRRYIFIFIDNNDINYNVIYYLLDI